MGTHRSYVGKYKSLVDHLPTVPVLTWYVDLLSYLLQWLLQQGERVLRDWLLRGSALVRALRRHLRGGASEERLAGGTRVVQLVTLFWRGKNSAGMGALFMNAIHVHE